jgi:hypothetical protein
VPAWDVLPSIVLWYDGALHDTFNRSDLCVRSFIHALYVSVQAPYGSDEGYMIEGYTTEEVIECYIDYIKDVKPIGVQFHDTMVDSLEKEPKEGNQ